MWKLTIMQERASEHGAYNLTEKVSCTSDSLEELCVIIGHFAECNEAYATTYKIEKVGEE